MAAGKTKLVCEGLVLDRKRWRVSTRNCRVAKEGNGKGFEATLSAKALAHKKATKAKRSREAKKRFGAQSKAPVEWKCKTTKVEGRDIIGRNCTRTLPGFGGKRKQTVARITLAKTGR